MHKIDVELISLSTEKYRKQRCKTGFNDFLALFKAKKMTVACSYAIIP